MTLRQKIIMKDSSFRTLSDLVQEFVANTDTSRLFPPEYIDEIRKIYDDDPSSITLKHFDKLHGYAISYFQDVFENHFRRTKSFQYIK